jgi:hypothetical protein
MTQLHPTRLSTTLTLYRYLGDIHSLFRNTTHFELVVPFFPSSVSTTIDFPSLSVLEHATHLCLSWVFPSTGVDLVPLLQVLTENSKLQVIIINFSTLDHWLHSSNDSPLRDGWVDGSYDKRIVVGSDNPLQPSHPLASSCISRKPAHFTDDWAYRLPDGDIGLWELAEGVIKRRMMKAEEVE